jgi:hypothetical protein
MNERIKELAEQAGIQFPNNLVEGVNGPGVRTERDKLAEFAELIAYECMDLALGCSHREDDMGAIIANKIKKHFGVEE